MSITRYPLHNETDILRILDLVRDLPFASRHVIDLPWRLGALDIDKGCDAAL